jgi:hypothetical protein
MSDELEISRVAYRAFGDAVDWKNFRGDPMPDFDSLPPRIRGAWLASTIATIDAHVRATAITVVEKK